MKKQKIPFEERISTECSTINELFPIAGISITYYFTGAILLAKSRYLTWTYHRKIADFQEQIDLVNAIEEALWYVHSQDEIEQNTGYEALYYLMIQPFVEIYHSQKEREENENVYTNDIKRNL
ncbi:hypothetical protein [Roseburia sp. 499]|uniref:hypothetical protein n=1 Tax=Roseburia sp. 499 TaxID=1261634 RepID=UPI000952F647|nr:hypothetical protein [Roseburia sp. 499]WVK69425.1 hypothetical protein BIV20_13835 [Roseburia sp. 499]